MRGPTELWRTIRRLLTAVGVPVWRASHRLVDRVPNPVRLTILWLGLGLSRLGLVDRDRAVKTTELAWPRVVTGIARMSKNAVDVAMVGVAVGTTAVAGVGFASPFWGLAFSMGGGIALGYALENDPDRLALVNSYGLGTDAYWRPAAAIALRTPGVDQLLWNTMGINRGTVRSAMAAAGRQ